MKQVRLKSLDTFRGFLYYIESKFFFIIIEYIVLTNLFYFYTVNSKKQLFSSINLYFSSILNRFNDYDTILWPIRLCLCVMIFVNYGGGGYSYFSHSIWNGLTIADTVFPWFVNRLVSSIFYSSINVTQYIVIIITNMCVCVYVPTFV